MADDDHMWRGLDNGLFENCVAMLLCAKQPFARQIRPSRGDRGIDIYVPVDERDPGGSIVVYQVKYFTEHLRGKRHRDITSSLTRAVTALGSRLVEWHLVVPQTLTFEEDTWFNNMAMAGAPGIPCQWDGLAFLEGLAGENQAMIDYKLRGDARRLEQRLASVASISAAAAQVAQGDTLSVEGGCRWRWSPPQFTE